MEKNSSEFMKSAMNSGAIMGIALIIVSVILYIANLMFNPFSSLLSIIVFIGVLFFTGKNYRDTIKGGYLSYGQALGYAVVVSAFAGILSSFYHYIFITIIDPEFLSKMLDLQEQNFIKQKMTEVQIEAALSMVKKFSTPMISAVSNFFGTIFIGTIVGLITSAFIKKDANPFTKTVA